MRHITQAWLEDLGFRRSAYWWVDGVVRAYIYPRKGDMWTLVHLDTDGQVRNTPVRTTEDVRTLLVTLALQNWNAAARKL